MRKHGLYIICLLLSQAFCFGQHNDYIDIDTIGFTVDLEDYVITAQYRPTHYKNALHKTHILDKQSFEDRGATHLDNALAISSKIRMSYDPVLGTQLKLRGIGASNVAVLIDGVPVIGRSDGGLDLSQISLNTIERIELIEGPVSAIYGNNAAGGVINIITKSSQLRPLTISGNTQVESIGKINNQINVGVQEKRWFFNVFGQYFNYDQFPEDSLRLRETVVTEDGSSYTRSKYPWNPKEQYGGGATAKFNWQEDAFLRLNYRVNTESVSDLGQVRRKQFNPYAQDMFFTTMRHDASLALSDIVRDDIYIDAVLAYNSYSRTIDEQRFYFETNSFDSLLTLSDKTSINALYSKLNVAKNFNEKLEVIGGLNYVQEMTQGGKLNNENSNEPDQPSFNEVAIYSEVKYSPSTDITFAAGGRLNRHSVYENRFTPSLQLKWSISDQLRFRSSFAQGYRSPSLKELYLEFIDINHFVLGNENLKPEISTDIQVVMTYEPYPFLAVDFNAYKTSIKNRIDLVQYEPARYRYDNINAYDVYGFSTDYQFNFKNFELDGSLSLGYWSTGIEAESIPLHGQVFDWNQRLSYNIPRLQTTLNVNYRHQGSQPVYRLSRDEIILNVIDATNFIDCTVNKNFLNSKLSVTTGVKNVLNQRSVDVYKSNNDGNHTTQEARLLDQGRSFFLRLGWNI